MEGYVNLYVLCNKIFEIRFTRCRSVSGFYKLKLISVLSRNFMRSAETSISHRASFVFICKSIRGSHLYAR